jgi:hypothetical protein
MFPKLYIGPMSKNIVDSAISSGLDLGLIPSRRQVDYCGGYVNSWNTASFVDYVRERSSKIKIQRDHGGPEQGQSDDDGLKSLQDDAKNNLDLIHIDPWKKFKDIESAALVTMLNINACCDSSDNNCSFEVGTEQAIREYSPSELETFLNKLKKDLGERFNRIKFAVIQSGVGLLGTTNTGVFDEKRCEEMISVCKDFDLFSKEHNGDYLKTDLIKRRFDLGLDGINIAPELGVEESRCVLKRIEEHPLKEELFESLFKACYLSKFWVKWLPDGFFPKSFDEKRLLVEVCCHYIFNTEKFEDITIKLKELQPLIKEALLNKINLLHESCSMSNRNGRG